MAQQAEGEEESMKFRKKPIVVEAVHFTKDMNERQRLEMLGLIKGSTSRVEIFSDCVVINVVVNGVKKGIMKAIPGDWLIRGTNGEVYPCKAEVFEEAYEPVIIEL